MAHAWSSPTAICVAVEIPLTATGVSCAAGVLPFPSWPSAPEPQHEIVPPSSAQPKKPPIATWDTPVTPEQPQAWRFPLMLVPLPDHHYRRSPAGQPATRRHNDARVIVAR